MALSPAVKLSDDIRGGALLDAGGLAAIEADKLLTARDTSSEFDDAWTACSNEISAEWSARLPDPRAEADILELRELAFKAVFAATRNPDLAGYVSDDFELIAKSLGLGRRIPFAERLLADYRAGLIPGPRPNRSQ
jgi:hypothetical protein